MGRRQLVARRDENLYRIEGVRWTTRIVNHLGESVGSPLQSTQDRQARQRKQK